ncbi:MAG: 1-acyl-sn-glycerol-3-phosphate acyltransferase [Alphaproteobacteria bacterium]|nr:1-acyl-sn-glycerol-3-phosphate acyltransferase [Alphaproteobacteria bacterium]
MILVLRSLAFHAGFVLITALLGLAALPALAGPPRWSRAVGSVWSRLVLAWVRRSAGLTWRIEGTLPPGPIVIAAKHQSAFETYLFPAIRPDAVFVLKRELLRVPLVGWYLARSGQIAIDRQAGMAAMRQMLAAARKRIGAGLGLVIFPEGTRVAPGRMAPLHPGVRALYTTLDVPVVPVTLDSGHYWARNSFLRRPGCVRVVVRPALPPGLNRRDFDAALRQALAEPPAREED